MISPKVRTGIEKSSEETCLMDNRSDVAAFRPIAKRTGVRQIAFCRLPAVFLADDVIDFAAEESVFFVDQAVFTQVVRPRRHELAQSRANVAHPSDELAPELWLVA